MENNCLRKAGKIYLGQKLGDVMFGWDVSSRKGPQLT